MLRYKTETRPGLVALYDNRPGNGAGQFLRPRSPHRAAGRSYHNKPILVILPYLATLHQTVWMHIAE